MIWSTKSPKPIWPASFCNFGEERASRRIARAIVEARRRHPIETTAELRALVERAIGPHRRGGVHPATRTFQALRIAVNREMESLDALLARRAGDAAPRRHGWPSSRIIRWKIARSRNAFASWQTTDGYSTIDAAK